MCTVTYFPKGNNEFILTSNRDETPLRKTILPQNYSENNTVLTYPKDELAGGTWIGLSEKKRLVCLLNGGFKNHIKQKSYKVSRGVIVKNILSEENAVSYIEHFDFSGVEPFTLILVDWTAVLEAHELVWDGENKHFNKLPEEPKIWSSSTLYTQEMKELRKEWFQDFLEENSEYPQEKIVAFHQNEDLGTKEVSLKMKRPSVETVSVTSVKKEASVIKMSYLDFVNNQSKVLEVSMKKETCATLNK